MQSFVTAPASEHATEAGGGANPRALTIATPAPGTPFDDPLITAGTACAIAGGVSRMTLWRWREAGIIPNPVIIRGRNYFRRGAFLAALAAADSSTAI